MVRLDKVLKCEELETFDLHWQWTLVPHAIFLFLWDTLSRSNSFLSGSDLAFLAALFLGIFLICAYIYWCVWLFKLLKGRTKLSGFFTVPLSIGGVLLVILLINALLLGLLHIYFPKK